MLIPLTILQILEASTLLITLLLLVELQWIRFPLIINLLIPLVSFIRIIKQLIQELKFLLFIKKLLMNIKSFTCSKSKVIYLISLSIFFICYFNCLFNIQILTLVGFWCYTATDRLNKASSWQIKAIYAPQTHYLKYSYCGFSPSLLTS